MQCKSEQAGSEPEFLFRTDRLPDPAQVAALYREVGWIKPEDSTDFIPAMLKNSFMVVTAHDRETDRLAGMMRALSDGVSDAYILDLVVTEKFRKQGLGKKILDTLTDALKAKGLDWVVCIGAPGTESFYSKTNAAVMDGYTPYRF